MPEYITEIVARVVAGTTFGYNGIRLAGQEDPKTGMQTEKGEFASY